MTDRDAALGERERLLAEFLSRVQFELRFHDVQPGDRYRGPSSVAVGTFVWSAFDPKAAAGVSVFGFPVVLDDRLRPDEARLRWEVPITGLSAAGTTTGDNRP